MQTFLFGLFGSIFLTSIFRIFIRSANITFNFYQKFFLSDYIVASLWIGFILQTEELSLNGTAYDYAGNCGSQNCRGTLLPESTSKPTINSIYILFGTVAGSTLLSIIITILFVDDLKYNENNEPMSRKKISLALISISSI